jgi:hypothetical protein
MPATTSPARLPSRRPVFGLAITAVSGWLTTWAIDAAGFPSAVTLALWASCLLRGRQPFFGAADRAPEAAEMVVRAELIECVGRKRGRRSVTPSCVVPPYSADYAAFPGLPP